MNTFNEFELNRIKKLYSDELESRLQRSRSSRSTGLPATCGTSSKLDAESRSADRLTTSLNRARVDERRCFGSSPFVDPHRYQRALLRRARSSAACRPSRPDFRFGRALFDFQAKSGRELSLRRGDLVEMLELLDHNWARVEDCQSGLQGLVPLNYIDYSVGCAVAKRDVKGQQRVKTRLACVAGADELLAEAHLLPMSKGEPITLIRRLSGHWYEASNTRQTMGLVWSNDLDIIKQPVLGASQPSATVSPSPFRDAGLEQTVFSDEFTDDEADAEEDEDEEEMLILDSGERVLARRRARSASGTRPDRAESRPRARDPRLPRRSSSSPYISAACSQKAQLPAAPNRPTEPLRAARLCRAKFAYKPRQRDELELVPGDLLVVMHECDDGWFVGSSHTSKLVGTFPGNFVEFI